MQKLQQFFIFKISTKRLKKSNYNLHLSIRDARKSGELVSVDDSQMLRTLRKIKNSNFIQADIDRLFLERKRIKSKKYSKENSIALLEIEKNIDNILFVPEIVSVLVSDICHYEEIGKNGFYINGIKYKRFICGAGQARRNNGLFIDERFEQKMLSVLENGRSDIEIVSAKYSAYFSLASSATLEVTEPYFCVVPDKIVERTERVDFVVETQDGDDLVEERDEQIKFNLWDGQGVISPKFAKQWAADLGLDYVPSAFIVRANFVKGMVAVIDFHRYAEEIAENHYIIDIWGNKINIRDMDIILTESQFKLWNAYDSCNDYVKKCRENSLGWGVSRFTPKHEKKHTFLNYQFIQALNPENFSLETITQKTLEYFSNVSKNRIDFTLLYLLGKMADEYDPNIFDKIHDNITKALILNNDLLEDPYIKNHLISSLNKKIRESYIGNLLVDGSYTMMISDPYAFLEYLFGLEPKGLLDRDEHYNHYWLEKGEKQIVAMRAPLTWRSEVNVLNLKRNSKIDEWFQYLKNCIIYNVHGNDCLIHGGSDFDGDIVCITNSKDILKGAMGGLPIHYASKSAQKEKININNLYKSDINGFNNKVGFVTNVATTAFAMLPLFEKDSPEYVEMIDRLKRFRKEQGSTIDATKGLIIKPFPVHWTRWDKTKDDKEKTLTIDKRPYFMRWLYPHYNKKYMRYKDKFSEFSKFKFNKSLDAVLECPVGEDENNFVCSYKKHSPLLETDCIMYNLAKFMEKNVKEIKNNTKNIAKTDIIDILTNKNIEFDEEKYKKLDLLYRKYKKERRNFEKIVDSEGYRKYKTMEQYNKYIRQESYKISSSGEELANLAVYICYIANPKDNKSFVWQVFGSDLVNNIYKNRQDICKAPFLDVGGDIEYLGDRYSMFSLDLKEEIDYDDYLE